MRSRPLLAFVLALAASCGAPEDASRLTSAVSALDPEATPAYPVVLAGQPYEVGVKFSADADGTVAGVRFFKGAGNDGAHTGHLWTDDGTLLATVEFSGETASGWQQANFGEPVPVAAGTTYVASYHSSSGFAFTAGQFASAGLDNPPLHLPVNAGVYAAGPSGTFPASTNGSNYWVDVDYTADPIPPEPPVRIWDDETTPAIGNVLSGTPYEVGVRFSSSSNGSLTTVLFYKDAANTGTHPWTIWDTEGTPLATGTFTGETASGWQRAELVEPLAITAGTTYVASYHSSTGFAYSHNYLLGGYANAPLSVPALGGVYAQNVAGTFPTTGHGANYWVDVEIVPEGGEPPPPVGVGAYGVWDDTATPTTPHITIPMAFEVGVRFRANVPGNITSVQFYKGDGNNGVHTGTLWATDGTPLATGTFTGETASGWQRLMFTSPVAIAANTEYRATVGTNTGFPYDTGFFGPSGLSALPLTAIGGTYGVGFGTYPAVTNATNYWVDVDFDGTACVPSCDAVECGSDDGCGDPCCTGSGCFPSDCGECESANPGGCSLGCAPLAEYSECSLGTCRAGSCTNLDPPMTLWDDTASPSSPTVLRGFPYEVGVKFTSDVSTNALGVRFFKGATNDGAHTAHLWTFDGVLLATADFTDETASGWQRATFSTPVALTSGVTYVASYHSSTGFAYTASGLASGYDNPPLHVPAMGGVFVAGPSGTFPTSTNGSNYWVDVDLGETTCVPSCDAVSCGADDGCGGTCCVGSGCTPEVCSECEVSDVCGSFCSPATDYSLCTGGTCQWGICIAPDPVGLWTDLDTPGTPLVDLPGEYVLGTRFTTSTDGVAVAIQFYKGAGSSGTHAGTLWMADGTPIYTGTFTGETASGWQRLAIPGGQYLPAGDYVVSFDSPQGQFAYDAGYFAAPYGSPPLSAPASAGVYAAGPAGTFPTLSNGASYWVDVEWVPYVAD